LPHSYTISASSNCANIAMLHIATAAIDAPIAPLNPKDVNADSCRRLWAASLTDLLNAASTLPTASSSYALDRLRDIASARRELIGFANNSLQPCILAEMIAFAGLDPDAFAFGIRRLAANNWRQPYTKIRCPLMDYVSADGRAFYGPKPHSTVIIRDYLQQYPMPGDAVIWR